MQYPLIFQNLIDSFKKLPGVGAKTAERMAYDVLNMSKENIEQFATSILSINNISRCPICGNLSENNENCELCDSEERDHKTICVVHGPKDVFAFEKMKELASKLSVGMPQVRVDFYEVDGKVYFGEFNYAKRHK